MTEVTSADAMYGALIAGFADRREEMTITQLELDVACGFSEGMIGKYESGVRRPGAYALCVWAAALDGWVAMRSSRVARLAKVRPWREEDVEKRKQRRRLRQQRHYAKHGKTSRSRPLTA